MTALAIALGVLVALVLGVVGFVRRRRAVAPQRVSVVTVTGPARPRWERHGLRSPADIPRPVEQLERDQVARYRLAVQRPASERDCS